MKLRRKLLSAGFALGATALTLTTSTFAWYTSNTEVNAKTITGKTSAEADTDSIYIAAAKTYYTTTADNHTKYDPATFSTYGKEAQPVYVGTDYTTATKTTLVLAPVSYVDSTAGKGAYLPLDKAEATDPTNAATVLDKPIYKAYDETNVMEFVLRFRTATAVSSETKIYFSKFDLVNTASTVTNATRTEYEYEQTALAYNSEGGLSTTGIKESGAYGVDFRKALKMTVKATNMTDATTVSTATTATKTSVLDFEKLATNTDVNIADSGANALGYLNAVMGYSLSTPSGYLEGDSGETKYDFGAVQIQTATKSTLDKDTAYSPFAIPKEGYLEVRFTIWLDGWDSYCYDVCRKQGFTLDMAFTTNPAEAVIK